MRYLTMYLANAFTDRTFSGNTTGIVISNGQLNDEEMQNLATDLNITETVFINRVDTGVYSTRFFTPFSEIDLCGHATIATFYALCEHEYIPPIEFGTKSILQHTNNAKIPVDLEFENNKIKNVYMKLKANHEDIEIDEDRLYKILGLNREDVFTKNNLKPMKIKAGSTNIVVPVKNNEILQNLKPDFDALYEYSKEQDIISVQVFTLLEDEKNVIQRTFSPIIGVKEEAGSGTSVATNLYYLYTFYSKDIKKIYSFQGSALNRPSSLSAQIIDHNEIKVGGRAYVFMNGVLNI